MSACHSCGVENPPGKRFCGDCGAPIAGDSASSPAREERRVVTVLFSDLAGFTARSENLDPEDARALLVPYYDVLQTEITGHGGVVERHIGDGIMALFGAPVAHEDDPERAIRAALRILERIPALGTDLHARIGINTGEILYRSEGQGREDAVTGDAANTAARLQGLAPIDGVVVGEATWRATSRVFEYAEQEPASVKGKATPIRVFQPITPRARFGVDLAEDIDTPFVGREIDFTLLKGLFAKSVASDAVQLVTVVGEPGIGKSRLVAELSRHVEDLPDLITWRQGRCLPYGEGITFWALGEIVKAHAGILDSDPPELASSKLEDTLPEGQERPWFLQRLLPLLGIEASSSAGQEELFTAWRRYLEHLAEGRPTVLVFEDLHWADDAMLAFLEHLADRAEGVPMLVVGTSRPELYGRRSDFGSGLPNANRINLAPLTVEDTGRLVSALLETDVIPTELRTPILDRASGNPLYAEEFVRLLKDQGLLVKGAGGWSLLAGAEVPLPESVQALIAARLDTLSSDAKSLLADAAVIGKVFWAGAVAEMGGRDLATVVDTLRDLSRKELVRAARRSTMQGEVEYAFWHILARDVAYGQLSRAARATRHLTAARWIEGKAGERVEDVADVLAFHHSTALEMARSSGQRDLARDLESSALRFLLLAGERALGLDTAAALGSFERALALVPVGDDRRPDVLWRYGEAASNAGRVAAAASALEEALAAFRERDDKLAQVRVLTKLAAPYQALSDSRQFAVTDEALRIVEALPPGPDHVTALSSSAAIATLQDDPERAIDLATRAMDLAASLEMGLPARALSFRGCARLDLNDRAGIDDVRAAIQLAIDLGDGREAAVGYYNLANDIQRFEGLAAAIDLVEEGLAFARRRGIAEFEAGLEYLLIERLAWTGEVARSLTMIEGLMERIPEEDSRSRTDLLSLRIMLRTDHGEASDVEDDLVWVESTARAGGNAEVAAVAFRAVAGAQLELGNDAAAMALVREMASDSVLREAAAYGDSLPDLVGWALGVQDFELAEQLIEGSTREHASHVFGRRLARAMVAEARGAFEDAARTFRDDEPYWANHGSLTRAAEARLGLGRCLIGLGRIAEAGDVLRSAHEAYRRMDSRRRLAEVEARLATIGEPVVTRA